MQEPVERSKTRTSIVYPVTTHVKFQSPKYQKLKIHGDSSFTKRFSFHWRFFQTMIFSEKK